MTDRPFFSQRHESLCAAIARYDSVAVAFSGGVDSTFLLHTAKTVLGDRVVAFHAVTPLQTSEEQNRAVRFAGQIGCRLVRFPFDPFSWPEFVANPPDRCYLCKKKIYSLFQGALAAHGCNALLDGTNLDDLDDYRPGLKAVRELGCLTPLAECGFTKAEVRACSREAGLVSWEQPSSSCLATRIRSGVAITPDNIDFVARCENYLMSQGVSGSRVRWGAEELVVEVCEQDISLVDYLSKGPLLSQMACEAGFAGVAVAIRQCR